MATAFTSQKFMTVEMDGMSKNVQSKISLRKPELLQLF